MTKTHVDYYQLNCNIREIFPNMPEQINGKQATKMHGILVERLRETLTPTEIFTIELSGELIEMCYEPALAPGVDEIIAKLQTEYAV